MPKGHSERTSTKTVNKSPAQGDCLLMCDEQLPATSSRVHILCVGICMVFAMWVWLLNPTDRINYDQLNIATFELAEAHPENFSKDPVFGGNAARFYPSLYRSIIKLFTDKFGFYGGHRVVQFPLMVGYLVMMYLFLYYLTGSAVSALIVALFSLSWRDSMGAAYWGLDRVDAVQARSFVVLFVPFLLLMAWKFRRSWLLTAVFAAIGLLIHINPPGALFFAVALWGALLFESRLSKQRILQLSGAGIALIIGALPFIWSHISARMAGADVISLYDREIFMQALQYRFARMSSYPVPLSTVGTVMLSFSLPLLLATAGWAVRGQKRDRFDRWLLIFFLITAVGFVIIQYLMQKVFASMQKAPPLVNVHRAQKYAYLILYIYSAVFVRYLLLTVGRLERRVVVTVAFIALAITPLVTFAKQGGYAGPRWKANSAQLDKIMRGEKIGIEWHYDLIGPVAQWVRKNTPPDSLILFGHYNMPVFRIYALRGIVGAATDGDIALYNGPERMIRWYKAMQVLGRINSGRNGQEVKKLAETAGADYIILPRNFPELGDWSPVAYDRYWVVYAPKPTSSGKPVRISGS